MFGDEDLVVAIPKVDLLVDLRHNREQHREVFEAAVRQYHAKAMQLLEQRIRQLLDHPDEPVVLAFGLPVPEDHTSDYDRVIAMIERHTGTDVTITETRYRNYVNDEWSWTNAWRGSTASYIEN